MKRKWFLVLIIVGLAIPFILPKKAWGGCAPFQCGGAEGGCFALLPGNGLCNENVLTTCEIPFSNSQDCSWVDCVDFCWYCGCDLSCNCGGCFTSDAKIETLQGKEKIKDVSPSDEIESFNPQTNQKITSLVEKVHEVTRSAYYKIKLQDEKEVEVTGEHPLYAIQKENYPLTFWEYLKTKSFSSRIVDLFLK